MMKTILMLALLGSALVIVLVAGCRSRQTSTPHESGSTAPAAAVVLTDDEAACPVLGTVMKKRDMTPVKHLGKTYYMCCSPCISKFNADPEKYIAHPAPPRRGHM
ncbi:MAG: YHS domain protein [bacterium ADurb.Bin429]|nr:MAG: YHS domain protein [bacterium ADurb.Bin429]